MSDCSMCQAARSLPTASPAYRRALLAVVMLNLGMGAIELVGGVVARSQALQADSLDFLGDGAITALAFMALRRGPRWRARAALVQGAFLGALGIGVLAVTFVRIFSHAAPEAVAMGAIGAAGLVVNLLAAWLLIPHRSGDASARAVWLFSRNDALGNLAVVVAGILVAWTRTPWPDLAAALAIASLFVVSAWTIIRDARQELRAL